jgi:serine/threonine protein phosphatase PrpC
MDKIGYENVLTKVIGISLKVDIYYFENIVQKNDKILLCSDGLYNIINDDTINTNLYLRANTLVKKASAIKT